MIRADFYLKGVLTVIAVCLVVITLNLTGLLPTAQAGPAAPAQATRLAYIPLNADGTLTVRLAQGEMMDVNIREVDGRGLFNNAVPIDIRAVDGGGIFGGAVPVVAR